MTKKQKKTTNVVNILYKRCIEGHPDREAAYEAERQNLVVGQQIYDLRHAAGMTQRELADLVGTTASSICRLESADYEGHSLLMLRKIASALGQRIEIRFVPTGSRTMAGIR